MVTMRRKRYLFLFIVCLITILTSSANIIFSAEDPLNTMVDPDTKVENNKVIPEKFGDINLKIKEAEKVKLREDAPEVNLDSKIKLTPEEEELKQALEIQKGKDVEDIKMLWDATVERNPVIRFALEKVTSPPTQRAAKASLMARSIATMMQGAAIIPGLFSMGAATEYSSALGGELLTRAFVNKFIPPSGPPPITEPELIQLTGLIEDLQGQIIKNYYNYKSSLESLLLEQQNARLQEMNYQKSLASGDITAIIISSSLCDKTKQAQLRVKQQAKLYRIQLERLAGIDAVSNLSLTIPEEVLEAKEKIEQTSEKLKTSPEVIKDKKKTKQEEEKNQKVSAKSPDKKKKQSEVQANAKK